MDAIVGLVKDVTGAHLYTFFDDHNKKKRRGVGGRVYGFFTMWQHNGKPGHIFRRYFIRCTLRNLAQHVAKVSCCSVT